MNVLNMNTYANVANIFEIFAQDDQDPSLQLTVEAAADAQPPGAGGGVRPPRAHHPRAPHQDRPGHTVTCAQWADKCVLNCCSIE